MESLYLLFLNLGDFLQLMFYMIPAIFEVILSMWQTWAFIGVVFVLLVMQTALQYFFIDRKEPGLEE